MNAMTYTLTLLEPVFIPAIEGDPNSAVSYPYIPGSSVRGALIGAYMRRAGIKQLAEGDETARALFFTGGTRYLNAYPCADDDSRTLPTPLSWRVAKDVEQPIYDFAVEVRAEAKQWKPVASKSNPFVWLSYSGVEFYEPARQVNVHTTRAPERGRAVRGLGTVFQYQALAAGQRFVGVILLDDQADLASLSPLWQQDIWILGGSRNAGYGRVQVTTRPTQDEAWREAAGDLEMIPASQPFSVTLTSHTLVRDSGTGQYSADIRSALARALNATLTPADDDQRRGAHRVVDVGGFNRKWGMPMTQAQAVEAGSVFLFKADQDLAVGALREVEWRGIGERRVEGFGRLLIGWQVDAEVWPRERPPSPRETDLPTLTGVSLVLAEDMADRLLQRDLGRSLLAAVNNLTVDHAPTNAQLARLRLMTRDALTGASDLEQLKRFLVDIQARRTARDQFNHARVHRVDEGGGTRLSTWLKDRLDYPDTVWNQIDNARSIRYELAQNVARQVEGNAGLAREYTLRLIDGVLAKAAQERRRREG